TTGNHISLVEGKHSLEVKGDLARKVAGALGIKVESDIVLESSGSISLKAGGSFIVIHSGGVDIVGPKINLNGGGSPGMPVGTLLPGVLEALADDYAEDGRDKGNNGDGDDSSESENEDENQDDSVFNEQFQIFDNTGNNIIGNAPYRITSSSGQYWEGVTDENGFTQRVYTKNPEYLSISYSLE
ncbi:TPA: hypothetical protein ACKFUK_004560, partial [Citrobacter amalonaticus]